jgi:hypothetical protein
VNPLSLHLHRHTYWIIPVLIVLVGLLVFWALAAGGTDRDGDAGNPRR